MSEADDLMVEVDDLTAEMSGLTVETSSLTAEMSGLTVETSSLTAEMRRTMRRTRAKYRKLIDEERPASRRPRMPVAERAKQFAPFAALKKR